MIPGAFPIIAGAAPYKANAVHYDGSSYLRTTSALTGAVGGTQGTLSIWLKPTSNGTPIFVIGSNLSVQLVINSNSPNVVQCAVRTTGGTGVGQVNSGTSGIAAPAAAWHSIICSWDSSIPTAKFILDGVDVTSSLYGAGTIGWNASGCAVAAFSSNPGNAKYEGDMSELFVDQRYIDLSISSNVAKFRNATGKPAFLGINGERVFGTAPLVYLPNPAATVNVNQGSGGDFTITGSLTQASTSPSD